MKMSARMTAGFVGHHVDAQFQPARSLVRGAGASGSQSDQCPQCGHALRIETDGNGGLVQTCVPCGTESHVVRRMGSPGKKSTIREREG